MNDKYFNSDLIKRFVSDNNLPIPVLHDKEKFEYYLDLYEYHFHSRSLWESLCNEISIEFNDNINEFLDYYYEVRDKMITDILENPKYQEFLKVNMKQFDVCDDLKKCAKGNIYNGANIGKCFLSIDLKKGNFQALHYFDVSIVKNENTYEEYVSRYANSEYIQNSKYTRQVVFGKCNPARQITIEKHLMSKFYECFDYNRDYLKLVRFNNDEIVFEVIDYYEIDDYKQAFRMQYIRNIVELASEKSGVKVSFNVYKLIGRCLHSVRNNKDRDTFYILKNEYTRWQDYEKSWKYKFKEVPLAYHALCYKLWNGKRLTKTDYYFRYEGLDAYIDDEFMLKSIENNENKKK